MYPTTFIPDGRGNIDEYAFNEQIFDIIEPALEAEGYTVLEGDSETACLCSPDGTVHFQIKLIHVR